jgi:hypothetical protein
MQFFLGSLVNPLPQSKTFLALHINSAFHLTSSALEARSQILANCQHLNQFPKLIWWKFIFICLIKYSLLSTYSAKSIIFKGV